MLRLVFILPAFFSLFVLSAQEWQHSYIIRGEVFVEMEPIYAGHVDPEYPLDVPGAGRRALEEAALLYSAMIYGWTFDYQAGERARGINEILELELISVVPFGDPGLRVTDTEIREGRFWVWTDYHLSAAQQSRMQTWRSGMTRNAQAVGYGPVTLDENPGWLAVKFSALEDAARIALREALRGSERNRPGEVKGFISLASFPRFYIESGRWAVSARFRLRITEIIPFAAY